jgi:hypothetical protein
MNELLKTINWRQHRWNFLIAALACVALTAVILIHNNAEKALLAAQYRYQQQLGVNSETGSAAAVLTEFLPSYREFQKQGIIGQPQRLQWLETLQTATAANLIPVVHFTLFPTAVATATDTIYASDTLQLKITPMQVLFTLTHEGDFYRLFNALETQSKGIFSAQTCNITRSEGEAVGEKSNNPNAIDTANPESLDIFKGQCDLVWYSLADLTSAWEKTTP